MSSDEMPVDGEIRKTYGHDSTLKATVIPSARSGPGQGGSMGFDHDRPSFKQNIIVCEDNQTNTIAVIEPEQLHNVSEKKAAGTPIEKKATDDAPTPEEVEAAYLTAVNDSPRVKPDWIAPKTVKPVPEVAVAPKTSQIIHTTDIPTRVQEEVEQEIPKPSLGDIIRNLAMTQAGIIEGRQDPEKVPVRAATPEEIESAVAKGDRILDKLKPCGLERMDVHDVMAKEAEMEKKVEHPSLPGRSAPKTIVVTLKGPFGKVRQHYSSVFRDGNQLILMTDNNQVQTSYELPEIEDDAMIIEVQVNTKKLECVWAGISFTLPDNSVTFTILLIAEEHDNGS